jgi:hypothetical protein
MASANVDLVRSIYAGTEQGDMLRPAEESMHLEFVIADGPSPGRWTGPAGMAEAFRDFLGAWEDFRVKGEEYRELDDERVLVLDHRGGRGKTSGLEIGQIRTNGGPVPGPRQQGDEDRSLLGRGRAFADLGLAPEATTPDS